MPKTGGIPKKPLLVASHLANFSEKPHVPAMEPLEADIKYFGPIAGETIKRNRFIGFLVCLGVSSLSYLVDCVIVYFNGDHHDLPWLERGIYAPTIGGFGLTMISVLASFWVLIFGCDKRL